MQTFEDPTDDVIIQEEDPQQPSDDVTVEEQAEEASPVEEQEPLDTDEVDETGVPHKNRYAEEKRKYESERARLAEITQQLPDIIQQNVQQALAQNQSEQQPQYTEDQLTAYLATETNPDYINWARGELSNVREYNQKKLEQTIEERITSKFTKQQTQKQAEASVASDPRFAEAFTVLPSGQKTWNTSNPLAQRILTYMGDPRIKGQPDAILLASKVAWAESVEAKQAQDLTALKRKNVQLKKKTMPEGGGVVTGKPSKLAAATNKLRESGSETDAVAALKEWRKKAYRR